MRSDVYPKKYGYSSHSGSNIRHHERVVYSYSRLVTTDKNDVDVSALRGALFPILPDKPLTPIVAATA